MQINKIIILGGGTSGWMTASSLLEANSQFDITVIESPNIPTIGVGESSILTINSFFKHCKLSDTDWMRHCNATYKLSIDFTNWDGKGTRFHYPFGNYPLYLKEHSPIEFREEWFERQLLCDNIKGTEYVEFLFDTIELIESNKLTYNEKNIIKNFSLNGTNENTTDSDSAYHFDATLLGEYLKNEYCIPKGVTHIQGTYTTCQLDEHGYIKYLKLENDETEYHADLFIDCTGFKGILIDEVMGIDFHSYSSVLINDRALATTIPYHDKNIEMETNTNATTLNAGWCWNIPLYNRIGTGYVYSSQFLSDDEAEKEFREYLLKYRKPFAKKEPLQDFSKIKFKTGIREKPWYKNVVSIGLSSGFIEPLESTGLYLTYVSIMQLLNTLNFGQILEVSSFQRDSFNKWIEEVMSISTFILMHYMFSSRDDTPYWRHIKYDLDYTCVEIESFKNHFPTVQHKKIN